VSPARALVRKELHEDVFSGRGLLFMAVATIVLSGFAVLLVSNTELSLLVNAEALYYMAGIVLVLSVLVVLLKAADAFAGERQRQTLEPLLLTPLGGPTTAWAKLAGLLTSWVLILAVGVPYLWAVGSTGQNLLMALLYLVLAGTLVVVTVGSLMLALSTRVQSVKTALSVGIAVFLILASPLLIGASLRANPIGRVLDWINPVAAALNTLDSVIIDSQGLSFQAPRLLVLLLYAVGSLFVLRAAAGRITP
jgi:ABC-type Na+ efflux pump permease subunit